MAEHQRQLIRNAIRQMIEEAETDAGVRVYTNRNIPFRDDAELPAVSVFTKSENSTILYHGPRTYQRVLGLSVEAVVRDSDSLVADTLDSLCKQVEECVLEDSTGGGQFQDVVFLGTEMDSEIQGKKTIAVARLNFEIKYDTTVPTTKGLGNLKKVQTKYDLGDQEEADQSEQMITVPGPSEE